MYINLSAIVLSLTFPGFLGYQPDFMYNNYLALREVWLILFKKNAGNCQYLCLRKYCAHEDRIVASLAIVIFNFINWILYTVYTRFHVFKYFHIWLHNLLSREYFKSEVKLIKLFFIFDKLRQLGCVLSTKRIW